MGRVVLRHGQSYPVRAVEGMLDSRPFGASRVRGGVRAGSRAEIGVGAPALVAELEARLALDRDHAFEMVAAPAQDGSCRWPPSC
jgi:hypothetical protein